jgi:hypothetical protein
MNFKKVIRKDGFVGGSGPGRAFKITVHSVGFTDLDANLNSKSAQS